MRWTGIQRGYAAERQRSLRHAGVGHACARHLGTVERELRRERRRSPSTIGVIFGAFFLWRGTLPAVVVAHAAYNAMVILT